MPEFSLLDFVLSYSPNFVALSLDLFVGFSSGAFFLFGQDSCSSESVLRLEFTQILLIVINHAEAGGLASSELCAESVDHDIAAITFEFVSDFLFQDLFAGHALITVHNVQYHLFST